MVHANGAAEQDFLLPLRTEPGAETGGFTGDTKGAVSPPEPIPAPAAGPMGVCCGWVLLRGGTAGLTHQTPSAGAAAAPAQGSEQAEPQAGGRKINVLNRLVSGSAQNLLFDAYLGGWDWWGGQDTRQGHQVLPSHVPGGCGMLALPGQGQELVLHPGELPPSHRPEAAVGMAGTSGLSAPRHRGQQHPSHICSPDFPEGLSPQISKDRYLQLNCI